MKAAQLPSGKWRVKVYQGIVDGKRVWKSITKRTKEEALKAAALYEPKDAEDMSVEEACEKYLALRGPELSPSTVRSYQATLDRYIRPSKIAAVKIPRMTSAKAQEWLLSLPRDMSKKTKRNHFGFLSAVVSFFDEDKRLRVRIARTEEAELYTPTMDEINAVLAEADEDLRRAICLACFGLRRGEICALTAQDLDRKNCVVSVTKAYAKGPDGFVLKNTKTKKSRRLVPVSREVMDMLPLSGSVVSCSPDCITNRFASALKKAGVHHFRFHDLRSFFASISLSSAVGVSARTVQDLGGWQTDRVLKSHYERSISDQKKKDTEAIIHYFSDHLKAGTQ